MFRLKNHLFSSGYLAQGGYANYATMSPAVAYAAAAGPTAAAAGGQQAAAADGRLQ